MVTRYSPRLRRGMDDARKPLADWPSMLAGSLDRSDGVLVGNWTTGEWLTAIGIVVASIFAVVVPFVVFQMNKRHAAASAENRDRVEALRAIEETVQSITDTLGAFTVRVLTDDEVGRLELERLGRTLVERCRDPRLKNSDRSALNTAASTLELMRHPLSGRIPTDEQLGRALKQWQQSGDTTRLNELIRDTAEAAVNQRSVVAEAKKLLAEIGKYAKDNIVAARS